MMAFFDLSIYLSLSLSPSLFPRLLDVFTQQKKIEISTPYDPVHLTHVGFNSDTGEFTVSVLFFFARELPISSRNPSLLTSIFLTVFLCPRCGFFFESTHSRVFQKNGNSYFKNLVSRNRIKKPIRKQ